MLNAIFVLLALLFVLEIFNTFSDITTWRSLRGFLEELKESISQIAESKRLSTLLIIESKKDLGIKPEDVEPKKEVLRKSVLAVIEKAKHPSPETWAYCILDQSGLALFMDGTNKLNAQKVLGRLLANGNMTAVKSFLTKLVNAL